MCLHVNIAVHRLHVSFVAAVSQTTASQLSTAVPRLSVIYRYLVRVARSVTDSSPSERLGCEMCTHIFVAGNVQNAVAFTERNNIQPTMCDSAVSYKWYMQCCCCRPTVSIHQWETWVIHASSTVRFSYLVHVSPFALCYCSICKSITNKVMWSHADHYARRVVPHCLQNLDCCQHRGRICDFFGFIVCECCMHFCDLWTFLSTNSGTKGPSMLTNCDIVSCASRNDVLCFKWDMKTPRLLTANEGGNGLSVF